MNIQRYIFLAMLFIGMTLGTGCGKTSSDGRDHHDNHDDHAGHQEQSNQGQGDHDEHGDDVVRLSPAQLEASGVIIEPLGGGEIASHIDLPAEIGLNQDSVLHVTPRVWGIVAQVNQYLGDEVNEGDLLAVIESPELGEAKIEFLGQIQSKNNLDVELARQETISKNTESLLAILRQEPTPSELRKQADGLRIGMNKGRLLSAYTQMKTGSVNYAREKELNTKGLSTEADFLLSQEMFYSAQAEYMSVFEDIEFSYQLALQEAKQEARIAASSVDNAKRKLYLLGLTKDDVERVENEPNENIVWYELVSPGSGQIITKHLTPGERVGTDVPVYTISDLNSVWLNISVYSQYASLIKQGQQVSVIAGDRIATGVVEYIGAVITESSRTANARVVLNNQDRAWRPGEFVTVQIQTEKANVQRVVPIDAIQSFEGHDVVFVQHDDEIMPVQIEIGRRNDDYAELLNSDIAIGSNIVVKNSFLIKAELGKSAAGHDH